MSLRKNLTAAGHRLLLIVQPLLLRDGAALLRAVGILPRNPVSPDGPKSFLIVSTLPHLGDTVLLMPTIETLRAAYPNARIECACEASTASLLRRVPAVDRVFPIRLDGPAPNNGPRRFRMALLVALRYWQTMRNCTPDCCIVPRWADDSFQAITLASLTGAPRRIGFRVTLPGHGDARSFANRNLLTEAIEGGGHMHESLKGLFLLVQSGLIPGPVPVQREFETIASIQKIAASEDWPSIRERLGIDRPFAIVAPAATHPRRIWPLKRWANVISSLQQRGLQTVILTGPKDAPLATELHRLTGQTAILAAGATTLMQSATLIAHAELFLGMDSGPGHLAGALGVATVILFIAVSECDPDRSSASQRFHPVGPRVRACLPSHCIPPCQEVCTAEEPHCILGITVEQVLAAAELMPAISPRL